MRALIIETSTERGLIALIKGQEVIASKELPFGYNQSKFLMPELYGIVQSMQLGAHALDCIGVGIGPGSYTGIRIGVAVAKALAYAWRLPLIGVSSLQAFIPSVSHLETSFASMIDAKISGAYVIKGRISKKGEVFYTSEPHVYPLGQLEEQLSEIPLLVTPYRQSLSSKISSLFPHAQWVWQETSPSAAHLACLIQEKYQKQDYSQEGRLELLYLRKTQAELERERAG